MWRPGTLHYCYYNTFSSLWRPGSSLCLVVRYNDGNTLFVKKLKVLFFRDIPLDILHNRNLGEIKTLLQLVLKEADEGQLKKLSAFISEETHPSLKPESFLRYTNSLQGKDFKHFVSWHTVLNLEWVSSTEICIMIYQYNTSIHIIFWFLDSISLNPFSVCLFSVIFFLYLWDTKQFYM